LRSDFITAANNAVYQLVERVAGIALVVGFPERDGSALQQRGCITSRRYAGILSQTGFT
jgi:NAD+ synthase (glutamine-hydrolysing)